MLVDVVDMVVVYFCTMFSGITYFPFGRKSHLSAIDVFIYISIGMNDIFTLFSSILWKYVVRERAWVSEWMNEWVESERVVCMTVRVEWQQYTWWGLKLKRMQNAAATTTTTTTMRTSIAPTFDSTAGQQQSHWFYWLTFGKQMFSFYAPCQIDFFRFVHVLRTPPTDVSRSRAVSFLRTANVLSFFPFLLCSAANMLDSHCA